MVKVVERVRREIGLSATTRGHQGTEFISRDVDLLADQRGVTLDFSPAGKPTANAFIDAFNGRFRAECLNVHWFLSLAGTREKLEHWRRYDNEERPHGAIGQKMPIVLPEPRWRNQAATVSKPEKSTTGDPKFGVTAKLEQTPLINEG